MSKASDNVGPVVTVKETICGIDDIAFVCGFGKVRFFELMGVHLNEFPVWDIVVVHRVPAGGSVWVGKG